MNRRHIILGTAALALPSLAGSAMAQGVAFPPGTVKLIVGFSPGGYTDILARAITAPLSERFGRSFVVENRPGAAGVIAAEAVARANPDGMTLLVGHTTANAIVAALPQRIPYDPDKDFAHVTLLAAQPHALVVKASSPWRNVADLIAAAKADAGSVTYGSSGVASVQHVAGEMFAKAAGIELIHVPYRGSAPALVDLAAGQIQFLIEGAAVSGALVDNGQLRAIAVSSPRQVARFPGVPTISESGLPGYEVQSWFGLFAPAGTPAPLVGGLQEAVATALTTPTLQKLLNDASATPGGMPPAAFHQFIRSEIDRYKRLLAGTQISLT
jgi:tripartite-type tricarboxylate transporter receptor subunit TctC